MSTEWFLSEGTRIQVHHEGLLGPFVIILSSNSSVSEFITFSTQTWRNFRHYVSSCQTKDYQFRPAPNKSVVVKRSGKKPHIKLHNVSEKDNKRVDTYISLNENEWSKLLTVLNEIDKHMDSHTSQNMNGLISSRDPPTIEDLNEQFDVLSDFLDRFVLYK